MSLFKFLKPKAAQTPTATPISPVVAEDAVRPAPSAAPTLAQLLERAETLQLAQPLYEQIIQAEQGIELSEQSRALDAQQFEALGNLLLSQQRLDEAIHAYQQALALNPKLAAAANHLAVALSRQGDHEGALRAADLAIEHAPPESDLLADAHDTQGNALRHLQRLPEALASYELALALRPQHLSYLANRCSVLEDMDRYEDALAALREIRSLDPHFKCIDGRLLHAQRRCLDWRDIRPLTHKVIRDTLAGHQSDTPLNMLAVTASASVQLACARQALADQPPVSRQALPLRSRAPGDKIRIAYVSADLREHAVSYLMAGVFEQHDRSQFEVTAISLRPPQDSDMGRRVEAAFDTFVDVSTWSDAQIIDHMRKQGYDIAVDLMGLTFGARPGIWAHGIAPVQVSYLGYPGTTGAPYMDVILADETVIPPEQQVHYSEKVVYLPDCFQANDRRRIVAERAPSRSEMGLSDDAFVFCAFNNLYKIGPDTFDSWARILVHVPGSVLWLVDDQDVVRRHAQQEAHARGIDPSRLVFAKRATYAEHLARMKQADLFLDTLPFNAGTTASDALWAGLPVLTQSGEAFASRMAASLLRAAGLPELITSDADQYEALAVQLAKHPAQLQALRQRLVDHRLTCPLFDTASFTRKLEAAFRNML
ncbi:MAG: tetratricopeptide repeat protein [Acidobacteriota bacterium]